ncbi:MAG: pyridoxamine 5'-phosphate oxidase family protein [Oscillospiraceae bacterium]|nr:pyridoxamine 5'-phosphate oxidase family protein [Oscillospiraceae bacterium]
MFREMRRKRQILSQEDCTMILTRGTSGVLALHGDEGYPYAVPMSYVYHDGKIYFHSAKSGHKLDAIRADPKASFCVIGQDRVVPEEYTTYFRSVIVFGKIRILDGEMEKREAIEILAARYAPEDSADYREYMIQKEWKQLCLLELSIDYLSGKEAIELVGSKLNNNTIDETPAKFEGIPI